MDRSFRRRVFRPIARRMAVLLTAGVLGAGLVSGVAAAGATPPSQPAGPEVVGTVNEFIPENANLSDCISSLPRPECGSDARGGWRQTALFAVIVVVLGAIGVRLAVAVRRRDRANATGDDAGAPAPDRELDDKLSR